MFNNRIQSNFFVLEILVGEVCGEAEGGNAVDDADEGGVGLELFVFALFVNDIVVDGVDDPDENSAEERISLDTGDHVVNNESNPKDDNG